MSEEALKILGADEYGVNEMLIRIHQVLDTDKQLEIQVFPMTEDGGLADTCAEVYAWDILLRFGEGDPLHEFEDMTEEGGEMMIEYLQEYYPDAVVDWSVADLLQ